MGGKTIDMRLLFKTRKLDYKSYETFHIIYLMKPPPHQVRILTTYSYVAVTFQELM